MEASAQAVAHQFANDGIPMFSFDEILNGETNVSESVSDGYLIDAFV